MNCISKAILLSAVGLCVDSGNLTYASTPIPLSIPKKSGISTLHTHHTYIRHTIQRLNLSSRLFDDLRISGEEQKVASVCFITDTRKCSVDKFDNTDEPENGNGAPGGGSGETRKRRNSGNSRIQNSRRSLSRCRLWSNALPRRVFSYSLSGCPELFCLFLR